MNKKSELKDTRQYKRVINKPHYVKVPFGWCTRFNLSPVEILVYATVANFCKLENKSYTGSIQGLAAYWNISRNTALRALDTLIKRGFIGKIESKGGRGKRTAYIDLLDRKASAPPLEEQLETSKIKFDLAHPKDVFKDF